MKSPAKMTGGEINRELDSLAKKSSKVNDDLIAAGRGFEKWSETSVLTDPLAMRANAIWDRTRDLRYEIERRYGAGAPSRLPKGFGPRE